MATGEKPPLSMPLDAWLDRLAQPTGAPGGGAACGVIIAMGASLLHMVTAYTPDDERAQEAGHRVLARRARALAAAEVDGIRSSELGAALAEPEHPGRSARVRAAAIAAAGTSVELADVGAALRAELRVVEAVGNPNLAADTAVAAAAVAAGAAIVNDTGGLQDPAMREVVASNPVTAILMHIEGRNPLAVGERVLDAGRPQAVAEILRGRVEELAGEGITDLLVDPGLSINYRSDYARYGHLQLATIRELSALRITGAPVLLPVPRKLQTHRMLAYLTLSIEYGADVLRVHDVEVACDLVPLLGRRLGDPAS